MVYHYTCSRFATHFLLANGNKSTTVWFQVYYIIFQPLCIHWRENAQINNKQNIDICSLPLLLHVWKLISMKIPQFWAQHTKRMTFLMQAICHFHTHKSEFVYHWTSGHLLAWPVWQLDIHPATNLRYNNKKPDTNKKKYTTS